MKVAVFGLLLCATIAASDPDYYWRPYKGSIPSDALEAYTDDRGRKFYIGNVVVQGGGLYVGKIYPGNSKIVVSGYPGGVNIRDKFINILSTRHPQKFKWIPIESTELHKIYYHLVEGGHENVNPGVLYVGRTNYQGEMKIGKVIGYKPDEDNTMYFPHNGREMRTSDYEVLVYDQSGRSSEESGNRYSYLSANLSGGNAYQRPLSGLNVFNETAGTGEEKNTSKGSGELNQSDSAAQ